MKMLYARLLGISAVLLGSIGCVGTIPLTSTLSDYVSMNTKTNGKQAISFNFSSVVPDTTFVPYGKDKEAPKSGYMGYSMAPSATLQKMLKEYMGNKFAKLDDTSKAANITVTFKDFWIEQYSAESVASQLFSTTHNIICVAHAKIEIKLLKDTLNVVKNLSASSENNLEKSEIEFAHAKNINDCFNKLIMLLNQFLEENSL